MAEKRQKIHTSDGTVKITRIKRYQLGIENVSLKELRKNKKAFFITFKGLSIKQIKQFFFGR